MEAKRCRQLIMGRRKIHDEFTKLAVSRQRKYQLRRQKEGRCTICGKPKVSANFCLEHLIAVRERLRRVTGAKKRLHSLSYRLAESARAGKKAAASRAPAR
jgi:hypothetical protein